MAQVPYRIIAHFCSVPCWTMSAEQVAEASPVVEAEGAAAAEAVEAQTTPKTLKKEDSAVFNLHDGDSSDDEEAVPRSNKLSFDALDLETLFEFDTETLVKLAGKACGKESDPLESFWESSKTVADSTVTAEEVPESESVIIQRLLKSRDEKDKQIEVLKKTVCELLVWKATNARLQQSSLEPASSVTQPLVVVEPPKNNQMRADAPEFVSLGIPSLATKKSDTPPFQKHPVRRAPSGTRLRAASGTRVKLVPVPQGQRDWKDWRSERRANSQWNASTTKEWKEWKEKRTEVRGVQKKLKSGW